MEGFIINYNFIIRHMPRKSTVNYFLKQIPTVVIFIQKILNKILFPSKQSPSITPHLYQCLIQSVKHLLATIFDIFIRAINLLVGSRCVFCHPHIMVILCDGVILWCKMLQLFAEKNLSAFATQFKRPKISSNIKIIFFLLKYSKCTAQLYSMKILKTAFFFN